MLVLDRKPGQAIRIDGGIHVKVIWIAGNHVKLGITAPGPIRVARDELGELGDRGPKKGVSQGREDAKEPCG